MQRASATPQTSPARQTRRLFGHGVAGLRKSSWWKAIRPAARPSRRAIAPLRRFCRFGARSSTSPRPPTTRPAPTRNSPTLMLALGVQGGAKFKEEDLRYDRIIIMTDADVDGAHIASLLDHLLLSNHAGDGAGGETLPRPAPALPHQPRNPDRLCPRRRAQGRADGHRLQRAKSRRSAASRASAK